ncbi:MAG: DNA primase [Candidatus Nealsonbacteria bacterium]|nr:DNA primase [Candidatus Nealsonbacteria bacterium]
MSQIEEIKNRLDIVEVVGSYLKLQKTGANYRALCPFHSEKKPSFFVSPTRQIWHCFGGCGTGGDIFKFVMQIEGVEFGDALRILAQKAGVELKRQTSEYKEWQTERNRLYEVCDLATRFFEKQLEESKTGKEAKKYLLARGIKEESIKKWRLGYAPESWRGLSDFLVSQGYNREEIVKAGLAIPKEQTQSDLELQTTNYKLQTNFYDRFRDRIIFPIFDLNSKVVGFGGRVFKEKDEQETAKYINIPNTLLYDKSQILYGLDRAKIEIRKKDSCILVEGYTDVIMSHQTGIENVAATSGTALTSHQLKILKRYSENLILGFDMDIAGESASKRGINLAQNQGFNIKVIRLPEGKDAAETIVQNQEDWIEAVENPKSIMEFYFESAFSKKDSKTSEGKKEISKTLLPVIKRIPNQIERSFWTQKLAKDLEVKEEDIFQEMKKVRLEEEIYGLEPEEIINLPQKGRKELLEERLLTLILKSPSDSLNLLTEEDLDFFSPQTCQLISRLKKEEKPENLPTELFNLLNHLSLKSEIELEGLSQEDCKIEFQECQKEIKNLEIKNKLDRISLEIKKAEEEKNFPKIEELIQEFNYLAKQLTRFQ